MAVSNKGDNHSDAEINNFRKKILEWYNKHQRALPWRATKDQTPNPYYVWLSEIMLQQTTVVTVGPYFIKFLDKWPTVHNLANAKQDDVMHEWAGLGYYARARNLHKCAKVVSHDLGGIFPKDQGELEKLPGIGSYTSAAIRAIAFNKPANVVDGNIERVMARVHAITEPLPDSKTALKRLAATLSDNRADRPGDYAQALMDLGATICTPKSPKCGLCPVQNMCIARVEGIAETLPAKRAKKAKPQKYGQVYWVANKNDEVLFVRRGEKEMLGGMLGLPTTVWDTDKTPKSTLDKAKSANLSVKHSFTHFDLKLDIFTLKAPKQHKNGIIPPEKDHHWVPVCKLEELGLPTLFTKVVNLMK